TRAGEFFEQRVRGNALHVAVYEPICPFGCESKLGILSVVSAPFVARSERFRLNAWIGCRSVAQARVFHGTSFRRPELVSVATRWGRLGRDQPITTCALFL